MSNLEQWPTARLIITAGRLVENAYNEDLAVYGITYAGLTVLSILAVRGALNQSELARELKIQSQTLGRTVEVLARRGFVTRTRHWLDRRSQLVDITPAGRNLLGESEALEEKLSLAGAYRETTLRDHALALIQTFDRTTQ